MKARVLALMCVCLVGCDGSEVSVVSEGQTYTFPRRSIQSRLLPSDGPMYVSSAFPAQGFDLIHSAARDERSSKRALKGEIVASINYSPSKTLQYVDFLSGSTVCNVGKVGRHCGLLIDHGGLTWSVLIGVDRVNQSEQIRSDAFAVLNRYRR